MSQKRDCRQERIFAFSFSGKREDTTRGRERVGEGETEGERERRVTRKERWRKKLWAAKLACVEATTDGLFVPGLPCPKILKRTQDLFLGLFSR
jgi:hypothetical protein